MVSGEELKQTTSWVKKQVRGKIMAKQDDREHVTEQGSPLNGGNRESGKCGPKDEIDTAPESCSHLTVRPSD